jgi:hypothetical protein
MKNLSPEPKNLSPEPIAEVLALMLDDMEFLGLIEFNADAGYWVVSKSAELDMQKIGKAT